MTPDPTTREGREELRRLLAGEAPIYEWRSRAAQALAATSAMLDALAAKDAEIVRLNAKLAALRDGIAEVVNVETARFKLSPNCEICPETYYTKWVADPSPAGAKLAKLWRDSDPQETPKA